MSDLREQFKSVHIAIEEQPEDSLRAFHYHYPLVDMMRKINDDGTTVFNPEKLLEQGINPKDFRTAWALGFAGETLKYYDNRRFTSDVVVTRCETCLKTDSEYAFGNLLPPDTKVQLEAKLMKNEKAGKQENLPTLNIA